MHDSALASPPPCCTRSKAILYIVLGLVLLGLAFLADDSVIAWVIEHQAKWVKNLAGEISDYGDWPPTCGATALVLLWAWRTKRKAWSRLLIFMIVVSTIAGFTANTVRAAVGRTRPNASVAQGWYGPRSEGKWLIAKNQYHGFPSGHSAAIAGLLLPLAYYRRRWAILALLLIAIVASSRIYLNAHHLSDVMAGILFGAAALAGARRWLLLPELGADGELRFVWPSALRK